MKRIHRRALVGLVFAVALVCLSGAPAGAHPLGNFTINHHLGLVISPTVARVDYVVDHAEIPAFQERSAIDADADGTLTDDERGRWAERRCAELGDGLDLALGTGRVPLQLAGSTVSLPAGQSGAETLRVECAFDAALRLGRAGSTVALTVADRNQTERIGWREITASGVGVDLRTELPPASPTARLTEYPAGVTVADVPRLTNATIEATVTDAAAVAPPLALGSGAAAAGSAPGRVEPTGAVPGAAKDPFTGLIARADGGVMAALAALGFAAVLGALHGLAPGHGKTVVAAYLVGTRGNRRQAAGLAVAVAGSHTLGVVMLGGVTLAASAAFPLERLYAWLQLVSAAIIVGLGVVLAHRTITQRSRRRNLVAAGAAVAAVDRAHHSHRNRPHAHVDHAHDHAHPHHDHGDHAHPHHDHGDHAHPHHDDHNHGDPHDQADQVHDHLHHDHDQDGDPHEHPHHDHPHPHGPKSGHDHGDGHRHGLFGHRHRYDLASLDVTRALSWRELAALGLSGGLVPSASAVIVLLGAVQLGRAPFGAALILSFGLGLAASLVGVGLGIVAVTRRSRRYLDAHAVTERLSTLLGPAAALAVLVVGAWLSLRAITVLR